ncbi:MAG: hypothetical protein JWM99_2433 [Verrucomicrobiales bacterium]|nr:hypothetical protein [Verrucomicrobiales bacterium]
MILLVGNYRLTPRLSERFCLEEEFFHLVERHFRLFCRLLLFGSLSHYLVGDLIRPILRAKTR